MKQDKLPLSRWAEAAKLCRKDLKAAFPTIKFSVTSSVYSGGSSLDIDWTEGPMVKSVSAIMHKYQYGHFDGMDDCYHMSNVKDIPQVKYVQTQRNINDDTLEKVFQWLKKTHAHFDCVKDIRESSEILMNHWSVWTGQEYARRILNGKDLTNGLILEGE